MSRHMNCHLQPPKRTCGHMWREGWWEILANRGVPCQEDGGRGCMQGWAQPLINIGVRCLCKILHSLPRFDVLVVAGILPFHVKGCQKAFLGCHFEIQVVDKLWFEDKAYGIQTVISFLEFLPSLIWLFKAIIKKFLKIIKSYKSWLGFSSWESTKEIHSHEN